MTARQVPDEINSGHKAGTGALRKRVLHFLKAGEARQEMRFRVMRENPSRVARREVGRYCDQRIVETGIGMDIGLYCLGWLPDLERFNHQQT
jgi:hypothetical protein